MEIKFTPRRDMEYFYPRPKPASRFIPNWYKTMPKYTSGSKTAGISEYNFKSPNTTLRGCSPFLDSLTSGYILELPCDIEVTQSEEEIFVRWRFDEEVISSHASEQAPTLPKSIEGKFGDIFKFTNIYNIQTPKGYSTLFTHPLNRWDLPFRTFSGVVETDKYPETVFFPFQFAFNDEKKIIIEKGTPIVQLIPFKRNNWKSTFGEYNELESNKVRFALFSKIVRSYKSQWWVKKSYN
jgi:hypothetical protein